MINRYSKALDKKNTEKAAEIKKVIEEDIFEDAINELKFYTLPIDVIASMLDSQSTKDDEYKEYVKCCKIVAKNLSKLRPEEAHCLLYYLKRNGKLNKTDVLSILACFTTCGLTQRLGKILDIEKNLVEKDSDEIAELHGKIDELEAELRETQIRNQLTAVLFDAVKEENIEVMNYLLGKKYFDIDWQNSEGKTALHIAAENGRVGAFKCLDDNGASLTIRDKEGYPPVHRAIINQQMSIIEYAHTKHASFQHTADGLSNIHVAAALNRPEILKYYIENTVNPSIADYSDMTTLHHACKNNNLATIDVIVSNVCGNVNSKDRYGNTPLHYLCMASGTSPVSLLLSVTRIDVNLRNRKFETPLFIAVSKRKVDAVEALLNHGADKSLGNADDVLPIDLVMNQKDDIERAIFNLLMNTTTTQQQ